MTRKHFRALAEAMRDVPMEAREQVAASVAEVCSDENPRFSFSTFYLACGLDKNGRAI